LLLLNYRYIAASVFVRGCATSFFGLAFQVDPVGDAAAEIFAALQSCYGIEMIEKQEIGSYVYCV